MGGSVTLNNVGSTLDISGSTPPNSPTQIIGDLTGASGTVVSLGQNVLQVGNSNKSTTFSGVMQDGGIAGGTGGGLIKAGTGKFSIIGNQTYTGPTVVSAGNLNVNGTLTSSVGVNSGAIFTGIANILSLTVKTGGTVQPGNSIGTMVVNGTYDLFGTYNVELNAAGQTDLIQVVPVGATGGNSILEPSSTLNILADSGMYSAPTFYTIITATGTGGATGTFGSVTQNIASLLFTVHYFPNSVVLELFGVSPFPPFVPANFSGNAGKAAQCFVQLPLVPFTDVDTVTLALENLTLAQQQRAFNHMTPAQFSALTQVQENNIIAVRSSYSRHMRDLHNIYCRPQEKSATNIWIDGIGQWQDQDKRSQQYGFDTVTGGVTLGADYYLSDIFSLGVAGSYTGSFLKWDSSAGHAHIKSYYGGVYGSLSRDFYYLDIAVIGAGNHYKVDRHIPIPGLPRDARHSNSGYEFLGSADYGYKFYGNGNSIITPFVRADYVYLHQNSYKEHGAITLDLEGQSKHTQWVQSEVGIRGTRCFQLCSGGQFIPELQVGYINQTSFGNKHYRASFVGAPCCCVIDAKGIKQERNLFDLSVAATILSSCELATVTGRYDAQIGSHYSVQEVTLNIDFKF